MRREVAPAPAPDAADDPSTQPVVAPGGAEPDPSVRAAKNEAVEHSPWVDPGEEQPEAPQGGEVEAPGESADEAGAEPEGGAGAESATRAGTEAPLDAESLNRLVRAAKKNPDLAKALGMAVLGIEDGEPEESASDAPKPLSDEDRKKKFYEILRNTEDPDREWKAMEFLRADDQARIDAKTDRRFAEEKAKQQIESRQTLRRMELEKTHPDWRAVRQEMVSVYKKAVAEIGPAANYLPPAWIADIVKAERARAGGPRGTSMAAAAKAAEDKKAKVASAQNPVPNARPAGPLERGKASPEEELIGRAAAYVRRSLPRLPS